MGVLDMIPPLWTNLMLPDRRTGAVNPAKDAAVGLAEDAAVVLAADIHVM
ncbi:hypothetical protein Cco03nite_09030 [Catellatospora coxensis]|uniref:Uncharacterized protein n=1 Tax=Catellatospora coxensis TaxID=310354 RepID=A0A8J3P4V5_9ACTN|nr:hypothetical protein Cco03nite_09030 [Catellatospora coxensis]